MMRAPNPSSTSSAYAAVLRCVRLRLCLRVRGRVNNERRALARSLSPLPRVSSTPSLACSHSLPSAVPEQQGPLMAAMLHSLDGAIIVDHIPGTTFDIQLRVITSWSKVRAPSALPPAWVVHILTPPSPPFRGLPCSCRTIHIHIIDQLSPLRFFCDQRNKNKNKNKDLHRDVLPQLGG